MFFDVNVFIQFVQDCRARGITVPILPGIMCIQNYRGFSRMTRFCKTRVPKSIVDRVEVRLPAGQTRGIFAKRTVAEASPRAGGQR